MKKALLVLGAAIALVAVTSIAVWRSAGDDSRRQGALEGQDPLALSWRGDWNQEAEYAAGNVVSHEGTSYVAVGEKLSSPDLECAECGWELLTKEAAPPAGPTTITSPNGSFKVEVMDTGIRLSGPSASSASILMTADSLDVTMPKGVELTVGSNLTVDASSNIAVKAGQIMTLESASNGFFKSPVLSLGCSSGTKSVARLGDSVLDSSGTIVSGSSKVFAC